MDWKIKALEELNKSALVEEVPGQENVYLVTVQQSSNSVLRTLVRLDEVNQAILYRNGHAHTLQSVADLIASMREHLSVQSA